MQLLLLTDHIHHITGTLREKKCLNISFGVEVLTLLLFKVWQLKKNYVYTISR